MRESRANGTEIVEASVRAIEHKDFVQALKVIKPSVCDEDLDHYLEWNKTFGTQIA